MTQLHLPTVTVEGRTYTVIPSPLARGGRTLVQSLAGQLPTGQLLLDRLVEETTQEARDADDVLYLLAGAVPDVCSPMEYGGHFLERDREILQGWSGTRHVLLYVQGGDGVYLDFVSDLPAEIFAWNAEGSRISAREVRSMRTGLLAATDVEAEVRLNPDLITMLEAIPIG